MYLNAVKYKGVWLAPGSDAIELHLMKDFTKLDKHLKELDDAKRKLEGRK